jgi:hypothetical protein
VATWLAEARAGLAAGEPALALTLGQDLWFLGDGRGDEAVALHAHRGLASVDVYA